MIVRFFSCLLLPLATLGGCDLYNADDTGADATCSTERALVEADLPCSCGREIIEVLPGDDCTCSPGQGLVCGEDTGIGR